MSDEIEEPYPPKLSEARPASYWVAYVAKNLGSNITERKLIELARKKNCFVRYTKPPLIHPKHIDMIYMEEFECRSNSNSGAKSGTSRAVLTKFPTAHTTEKAREELKKRMRRRS